MSAIVPPAPIAHSEAAPAEHEVAASFTDGLSLRSLVSSREAGVIIGRGGASIASIRAETNVKAGVSKVIPGVHERVLTITGPVDAVAKAYALVAKTVLENPVSAEEAPPQSSIRLLISHLLIGSVIGKGGAKIRQIQEEKHVRMVASKDMLPQSTERVVEITGAPSDIEAAITDVCHCLLEDWDRGQGTVLYSPGIEHSNSFTNNPRRSTNGPRKMSEGSPRHRNASNGSDGGSRRTSAPEIDTTNPEYREQKISIPSDMVGCIIGRGGTKINEIRRLSGSKISIAKTAHDETGERLFVISGLASSNERALFLLYNQLESEKERRVNSVVEEGAPEAPASS